MQPAEPLRQLRRKQIRPGRHDLAELHEGGAEFLKGRDKALVCRAVADLVWSRTAEQTQPHQSWSSAGPGQGAEHGGEAAIVR